MPTPAPDPITLEIIQNSLQAISDEMFAAMRKTAMSAIIYEVLDMGTGITDARRQPRLVRRRHPGLRRRARQGGEGGSSRSSTSPGDDRARRRLRHQRPVLRRRHAPERRRARDAGLRRRASSSPGRRTSPTGTTSAAWCRARSRPRRPRSSRRACGCPAVKLDLDRASRSASVMEIMKVNSRLPDFLRRRHVGRRSPRRASASGGSSSSSRSTASTRSRPRLTHFMDYGEQVSLRALAELPQGPLRAGRGAGQRRTSTTVTVEITDDEFVVDLRDNPDQDRGPEQRQPRRRRWSRADGLQEPHRPARVGERAATSGR